MWAPLEASDCREVELSATRDAVRAKGQGACVGTKPGKRGPETSAGRHRTGTSRRGMNSRRVAHVVTAPAVHKPRNADGVSRAKAQGRELGADGVRQPWEA